MEIWFVLTRNTCQATRVLSVLLLLVVNLTCRSYRDLQKQLSIACSPPFNGHVGSVQLLTQQATETPGRKITSTQGKQRNESTMKDDDKNIGKQAEKISRRVLIGVRVRELTLSLACV